MTAESLIADLHEQRRLMERCCGPVVVAYEPGCLWAQCTECMRKVATDDWQPETLRRLWNQTTK